jgi:predicted RNA-binding Zn-ribbon protein involved in translation (DUF1610 family)
MLDDRSLSLPVILGAGAALRARARRDRLGKEQCVAAAPRMRCPVCGEEMNHHANKVDYSAGRDAPEVADPDLYGVLQEVHQCPNCGNVELRRVGAS